MSSNGKALSMLQQQIQELFSAPTVHELAACCARLLERLTDAETIGVYLVDPQSDHLRLMGSIGFSDAEVLNADQWAMHHHPFHIPGMNAAESQHALPRQYATGSMLVHSVVPDRVPIGMLALGCAMKDCVTEETREGVSFVGTMVSIAYATICLDIARIAQRRKDLLAVAHTLVAAHSVKDVIGLLADGLHLLFEYTTLALYMADHERRRLTPLIVRGMPFISSDMDDWAVPMDQGIVGSVIVSGTAERVTHAERDPRTYYPAGVTCECEHLMVFPIVAGQRLVGVLTMNRLSDPAFTADDFELTQFLITYASLAIENAELFEQIKRDGEELRRSKQIAEDSLKAKEVFFARMSHEIRTPMNGIVGMTNLLLHTAMDGEQTELVANLKTSTDNLIVIVNDILDLEKIGAGMMRFDSVDFSPAEVLRNALSLVRPNADEKGLRLSLEGAAYIPAVVNGDPVRLNQILLNLITNAIKFTDHGSVTVGASVVSTSDTGTVIRYDVRDTGIGISEANIARLFQTYVQVHQRDSQNQGGTGLGLSIVKQLTELQGGTVRVSSTPGRGTVFTVEMPFSSARNLSPETQAASAPQDTSTLRGKKILVVEDIDLNQRVICKTLSLFNIVSEVAGDGSIALEMLRDHRYDLILMDVQMPVLDGYQTTKIIRQNPDPSVARIPIIAMTASVLDNADRRVLEAGMDGYVPKPFDPAQLQELLMKHLGPQAARQPLP